MSERTRRSLPSNVNRAPATKKPAYLTDLADAYMASLGLDRFGHRLPPPRPSGGSHRRPKISAVDDWRREA